jgi:hypothetical protein
MELLCRVRAVKPFLTCLLVLSVLVTLAGCGNNTPPVPPPLPNSVYPSTTLTNSYVFRVKGSTETSMFSTVGYFKANAAGAVTGGAFDNNDTVTGWSPNVTITGGSYTVGVDGRGQVSLTYGAPTTTMTFDFVLNSVVPTVAGQITGFTSGQVATGVLEEQAASPITIPNTNTYVSQLRGYIPSGASGEIPLTHVGKLAMNTVAGTATATLDENLYGSSNATFTPTIATTGTVSSYSATTGRGTLQLVLGSGGLSGTGSTYNFVFYAASSNRLELISTDASVRFVGGADLQAGSPSPVNGNYAFVMYGNTVPSGWNVNEIGSFALTGGTTLSGLEDYLYGTPASALSGSVNAAVGGRQTGQFTSGGRTVQFVLWYSDLQHAVMMTTNNDLLEAGTLQWRPAIPSNTTLSGPTSQHYALNLWGVSGCCLLALNGQVDASNPSGAGTFVGLEDYNFGGGLVTGVAASGSYSIDATTGRGTGSFGGTPVVIYPLDTNSSYVMTTDGSAITGSLLKQQ